MWFAGETVDRDRGLTRMRLVHVVGTRPQLIKAAALLPALRRRHEVVLVDTGQHWDERLAGAFFAELGLPRPGHSLGVGGGSHASQTARMLVALEPVLLSERPDAVVVYGDTNSTLAGALAAAKLDIPVAHVEAGLRSFDRRMPEEVNRVVADHLATWCFAPTPTAVANLTREGIVDGVVEVGDLMHDLASRVSKTVRSRDALARAGAALVEAGAPGLAASLEPGGFVFATIHRAENREPAALAKWPAILADVARPERPVILALHPGTRASLADLGVSLPHDVWAVEPLGYRSSLTLQLHAAAVITDSGGIQREAAWLGTPCLVLRSTTEWVEAVSTSAGRMIVIGLDRAACAEALERLAPRDDAPALAVERAAGLRLRPVGAARRIAQHLGAADG
jgi:UDP-N-acetylglucosamine 2-epimerase